MAEAALQVLNGPLVRHAVDRLSFHWHVHHSGSNIGEHVAKQGGILSFLFSGWLWIPLEMMVSRGCNELVAVLTLRAVGLIDATFGKNGVVSNILSVSVANVLSVAPTYPISTLKLKSQMGQKIDYGDALDHIWRGFTLLAASCVVSRFAFYGTTEALRSVGGLSKQMTSMLALAATSSSPPGELVHRLNGLQWACCLRCCTCRRR